MSTNPQVSQPAADVPSTQSCRQKRDPAWNHCNLIMEGKKKLYSCTFCGKIFKGGGINRVKQHLAGKIGDVLGCKKLDPDTRFRMEENLKEISGKRKRASEVWDDKNPYGPNVMELDGEDEQAIPHPQSVEAVVNNTLPSTQNAKRRATDGVPNFFAPRTTPGAQPTIKSFLAGKEAVHRVDLAIATFFYENCIPMNALNSISYQKMIDAIGAIGPGYKGPTYHAVRTNLLSAMKKEVQLLVDTCRGHWGETGCTIMGDGWQDIQNRQLINFLVYCPRRISQTSSSSSCERNWSVFERIHTKRRNRLEHQRLNDLVFVHYNLRLKNRVFNKKRTFDPIDYESIDDIDFWIMEEEDTRPILDFTEMENILYNEESIPIIGLENDDDNQETQPMGVEDEGFNLDSFPLEDIRANLDSST